MKLTSSHAIIHNVNDIFSHLTHFKGPYYDAYDYARMFPNNTSCTFNFRYFTCVPDLSNLKTLKHLSLKGLFEQVNVLPTVSSLKITSSARIIRIVPFSHCVLKLVLNVNNWIDHHLHDLTHVKILYTRCENKLNIHSFRLMNLFVNWNMYCKKMELTELKSFYCGNFLAGMILPSATHVTINRFCTFDFKSITLFFDSIHETCQSLIIHELDRYSFTLITPQNKIYVFKKYEPYNEIRLKYVPKTFIVEGQCIS